MTGPPPRKFTVLDGMVLIAATALGLGSARALSRLADSIFSHEGPSTDPVDLVYTVAFCQCLAWSFALLLLRVRPPRPGRRDLFRQPGFGATAAVAVTVGLRVLESLIDAVSSVLIEKDSTFLSFLSLNVYTTFIENVDEIGSVFAPAVVSVWLVQALGGVWEPEASWVDRCGRLLGLSWLILMLGLWPIQRLVHTFAK